MNISTIMKRVKKVDPKIAALFTIVIVLSAFLAKEMSKECPACKECLCDTEKKVSFAPDMLNQIS